VIVTRDAFERERLIALGEISEALNDEYGTIAGFKAGYIVDIDFEESKATGVVGIRMNNDFGVVSGDSAVEFSEALAYAAQLASKFKYLGCQIV
jgi:hypothetical protein